MKKPSRIIINNSKFKDRLNEIAKNENLEPNVIIDLAVKFYLALPDETRNVLNSFNNYSEEILEQEIIKQVTHSLLNIEYQEIEKQVVTEIKVDKNIPLDTEDDILSYAVSLTNNS